MCGIAGFWDTSARTSHRDLEATVVRMTATIEHRGPDDSGAWADADAGIALGARRLAIIDLSPAGHQPMLSASGRYVIAFNGEIYNFEDLRSELSEVPFRGHSDTEVILAAFDMWGVPAALPRFNGMFAMAVWDRAERQLYLARDRFGEKPLYYGWMGSTLLFGSELKALRAHPAFAGRLDRGALALYVRHNCIPAPYSIYEGVRKLPPASCMRVDAAGDATARTYAYWNLREVAERGSVDSFRGTMDDAVEQLDVLLRAAVRLRMVSDVPLGAFLSGGIDSSTVVALMQAQSSRPVRTFSIGLYESSYNEAEDAHAVAQHLHTEHTELYITPQEAMGLIPQLPGTYDEPFSDSSQIPTFLVSRLARRHVTVALSGDAGDEVFGGYNRYTWTERLWRRVGWMAQPVRRALAEAITSVSPQRWERLFNTLDPVLPGAWKHRLPGFKVHKMAAVLDAADLEEIYVRFASHWLDPAGIVLGATEPATLITDREQWAEVPSFTQQMMFLDSVSYLPDDILVKLDRASMAVSLEARVPMLDPNLVEFAWSLPLEMKVERGESKRVLRNLLARYLPRAVFERPKMGFGVPLDGWLRGPLRDWSEALLDERRLRSEGFFDPRPIREKWDEHLAGRHWEFHLWDILMFQAWLETTGKQSLAVPPATPAAVARTS
ncbi:MAG: asparagine synthase (glutamine-hydrolyzing) [Acidobacteriia bacterium]|nr:asparagine synthase (glutamine-hydrolyzing) [Terriglobia bacterium]